MSMTGFVQRAPKLLFLSSIQPLGHFPYVYNQTLGWPPFYTQKSTFLSTFVHRWSKVQASELLPRNVKVVVLQRKAVLFLPVPITHAGSCLLGTQMPTEAEPQLPLWIWDGQPSGLELASGNRGRWTQRKGKEADKGAETDLHPTAETPARGSWSGASCLQSQWTNY